MFYRKHQELPDSSQSSENQPSASSCLPVQVLVLVHLLWPVHPQPNQNLSSNQQDYYLIHWQETPQQSGFEQKYHRHRLHLIRFLPVQYQNFHLYHLALRQQPFRHQAFPSVQQWCLHSHHQIHHQNLLQVLLPVQYQLQALTVLLVIQY